MKNVIYSILIVAAFTFPAYNNLAYAAAEIKEVCQDKKDKSGKIVKGKDGKPIQECKKIKVHKKLEGTKIPEKAK
jgi:hypothetical protein